MDRWHSDQTLQVPYSHGIEIIQGTTTIDITGCSYVNVQAGVSGSNDAGAHWECHNCTITITLEE